MEGMFHERKRTCGVVPSTGMGQIRNLGMEYVSAEAFRTDDVEEESMEDEEENIVRSVNENYVALGLNRLCPLVHISDVVRLFLLDGREEVPERMEISDEVWGKYMDGFLRYARHIIVENLTTRDYIRDDFRMAIHEDLLKPGEAFQFACKYINDSFNPYNIVSRTRTADVERVEKMVMKKNPEYLLELFAKRIRGDETGLNEWAFKDCRNAWIALQRTCIINFFNSRRLYKGWKDFILEGDNCDVMMFIREHFRKAKPKIGVPRIFRIAATFLVFIPWSKQIVQSRSSIQSFEGGLVAALLIALMELLQRISMLRQDAATQSKRALQNELNRLGRMCKEIQSGFFLVEEDEEMSK